MTKKDKKRIAYLGVATLAVAGVGAYVLGHTPRKSRTPVPAHSSVQMEFLRLLSINRGKQIGKP